MSEHRQTIRRIASLAIRCGGLALALIGLLGLFGCMTSHDAKVTTAAGTVKKTSPPQPPLPRSDIAIAIERAVQRTALVVVVPSVQTNGFFELGYNLPPDASATGLIFYVGTTNGVFSRWLTCGLYDNATLRGLDPSRTNFACVTATNAIGKESLPSNVIAFLPRTNTTAYTPSGRNYTLWVGWSNAVTGILERTTKLTPASWTAITGILTTNRVLVTNTVASFYRLNGVTRAQLWIEPYQNLIGFTGPGVLQRQLDANSGSWQNILTNTSGQIQTVQLASARFRVKK